MAETKRIVRRSQIEIADRLTELQLAETDLRDCVLYGESQRDACTPNDPRTVPGIFAWAGVVRMLREKHLPKGWKATEKNGLPVIVDATKTIAIAVKSGDENTGCVADGISPKTKRAVGGAAAAAIAQNQHQLRLDLKYSSSETAKRNLGCATWFLLRRRHRNMVFAELSLPEWIGSDDRVEEWTERIILSPISLDPQSGALPNGPDGGPAGDGGEEMPVKVSVSRR